MTVRIHLDKHEMSFCPGETITGSVVASLGQVVSYESISLTFTGEGQVSWTQSTDFHLQPSSPPGTYFPRPRPHTCNRYYSYSNPTHHSSTPQLSNPETLKIYSAKESYLNHTILIAGKEGSGDIHELPEGLSHFQFSFSLPPLLPLSFETPVGNVKYKIIAKVHRTWYKLDLHSSTSFKVLGHLDLKPELGVADPVTLTQVKHIDHNSCYCNWLLSYVYPVEPVQGEIRFRFTLPRTGFVPGDSIPFTATLYNFSSSDVPSSFVSLIQTVKYFANGAHKTVSTVLSSSTGPGVSPAEVTTDWVADMVLSVPSPCLISRLGTCHLIHVTYKVKFEVEIEGMFVPNLVVEQPIVIGSVDLSAATNTS